MRDDLLPGRALFVGFKMDTSLKRMLHNLEGSNRKYVSEDDPSFLMICRIGQDEYVGKRVDDRLTTDRVDDVRRNVLSILQRLVPDVRLPQHLDILACAATVSADSTSPDDGGAADPESGPDALKNPFEGTRF